jgi:transcriptional regulator with GAF, ATPase, and Fis domain
MTILIESEEFERQWLETALQQARQVKSEAARLLGVNQNRVNCLCRKCIRAEKINRCLETQQ